MGQAIERSITTIPLALNRKPGVLEVCHETNQLITKSGIDLLAGEVLTIICALVIRQCELL
jgi:hypothetical protein